MRDFKSILIFGGLGFIGSEYILKARKRFPDAKIINFDSQNYATSLHTKELLDAIENYIYIKSDIRYKDQVISALKEFSPDLIVNFAVFVPICADKILSGFHRWSRKCCRMPQI